VLFTVIKKAFLSLGKNILMENDVFIQISKRVKSFRRDKGITVQELANKANVSKGFISQIENSRTIPSLMVLVDIIKALEVDLNVFFENIFIDKRPSPILLMRSDDYEYFEKEDALGFHYNRIITRSVKDSTVDIVLLTLDPGSSRPLVTTDAYEYKYLIAGSVQFDFEDQQIEFNRGDSILFDGRIPHSPRNVGTEKAIMLAIYFFEQSTRL
jgi:transcriptional regulator with XRE-family HTH domain